MLGEADGANLHDATGEAGSIDEDEAVERITVGGEGAGEEAVVARVVDRRVEIAVETKDMEFFVVLVLVAALIGNLDNGVNDFGTIGSYGEFQIIRHGWSVSSSCEKTC